MKETIIFGKKEKQIKKFMKENNIQDATTKIEIRPEAFKDIVGIESYIQEVIDEYNCNIEIIYCHPINTEVNFKWIKELNKKYGTKIKSFLKY